MSVAIHHGDSRDVLAAFADASIDAIVTDPPYALTSIVKRFGDAGAAPAKAGVYARGAAGFMGKKWDTGETAFDPAFWAEVLRVAKPGAHTVAFGGTRTYHRLVCAIEDAGWEIRDQLGWVFGSGFPKSHKVGDGWGTALKPAWEPICLARKPFKATVAANVLAHGCGAINIDGCRIGETGARNNGRAVDSPIYGKLGVFSAVDYNKGRWPANLIHDGSPEVLAAFPETGVSTDSPRNNGAFDSVAKGHDYPHTTFGHADSGSAARFFYSAKADSDDRCGSKHPTVKPVDLIAYLARLVTPKGGTVLDPFAGSGTLGMACIREGFNAILIEREAEYVADIRARIARLDGQDTPLFQDIAA